MRRRCRCLRLCQLCGPLLRRLQLRPRLTRLLLSVLQAQLQRRQLVGLVAQLGGERIKPLARRVLLCLQLAQALQGSGS